MIQPTVQNWTSKRDDELLDRLASGTEQERSAAFEVFYARHRDYLYAMCYHVANRYKFGVFDHDDLFQQTMLKAWLKAGTFDKAEVKDEKELEDAVDAWLGRIAENVALDLMRQGPKCVSFDFEWVSEPDAQDFMETETEVGLENEDAELIRAAIETLSPAQQTIMWAVSQFYERRVNQRTPTEELDEIVEALGMSKESFRKNKERARKKILQYIANHKTLH
jgi:RNA polymerase sigma factor (sigma-70 family)